MLQRGICQRVPRFARRFQLLTVKVHSDNLQKDYGLSPRRYLQLKSGHAWIKITLRGLIRVAYACFSSHNSQTGIKQGPPNRISQENIFESNLSNKTSIKQFEGGCLLTRPGKGFCVITSVMFIALFAIAR